MIGIRRPERRGDRPSVAGAPVTVITVGVHGDAADNPDRRGNGQHEGSSRGQFLLHGQNDLLSTSTHIRSSLQ